MLRLFAFCALVVSLSLPAQSLTLQHGHLASIDSYTDGSGRTWTSRESAFLAIRMPESWPNDLIDYGQRSGGISGYSGTVEVIRAERTSQASIDRWIILRLEKPCSGRTGLVSVGRVAVCPARYWTQQQMGWSTSVVYACDPDDGSGVAPIYEGTPPERVNCGGELSGPGTGPEEPEG